MRQSRIIWSGEMYVSWKWFERIRDWVDFPLHGPPNTRMRSLVFEVICFLTFGGVQRLPIFVVYTCLLCNIFWGDEVLMF